MAFSRSHASQHFGRYQIQGLIGTGGMGQVYIAYDRLMHCTVALKRVYIDRSNVLHNTDSDIDPKLALAQEFEILATLRHPYIINVLDYGFADDGEPYYTMELLQGAKPITDATRRLPVEEKLQYILHLLQALAYLHQRGIIHRDLKPNNILMVDGQVKVLDFGLSHVHRGSSRKKIPEFAGTLSHVAPEVLAGQSVTSASDLYALGLIAYEILSEQYPYNSDNINHLIMDILNTQVDVGVLPVNYDVMAVIDRMLQKHPDERYQSATDAYQALANALNISNQTLTTPVSDSVIRAAQFVGRDSELNQLMMAYQQATQGKGSAWLIGGESGVGKSRLLDEVRVLTLVQGAMVLRGQGVEGGGLTYHLWRDVMRHLVLSTPVDDLEAATLKTIVPDIDKLLQRPIPNAPHMEGDAGHDRLMHTIVRLFQRQQQPVVLLLEDLQWMTESLEPIRELLQIVNHLPLLLIGTYRDDERPDMLHELPSMTMLKLNRLSEHAIADLLRSILGEKRVTPQLVKLLARETEGNALFVTEIMRVLVEQTGLGSSNAITLPERVFSGEVQRILRQRTSRVPKEARPLLHLAAIAGRQLDLDLLQYLAPTIKLDVWLFDCANAAILEVRDGKWRFAHDQLRETILSYLPTEQRADLTRQVALSIEALHPGDANYAGMLMQYWHIAGDVEREFHYARLGGLKAKHTSLYLEAQRFIERALSLLGPDDTRYYELLVELGEIEWYLANLDKAACYLNKAIDALSPRHYTPVRVNARYWLSQIAVQRGAFDVAETNLAYCEQCIAKVDVLTQARVYYGLGDLYWRRDDMIQSDGYISQALQLARQADDVTLELYCLNRLGSIAFFEGDLETAHRYHIENRQLALAVGNRERAASAIGNLGEIARLRQDYEAAYTYYTEALNIALEIGREQSAIIQYANLGLLSLTLNDPDAARNYFTQVVARSLQAKTETFLLYGLLGYAQLYAHEGDLERGAQWLGLVLRHPAADVNVRNDAQPFFETLRDEMSPAALDTAMTQGAMLDFDHMVHDVLQMAH